MRRLFLSVNHVDKRGLSGLSLPATEAPAKRFFFITGSCHVQDFFCAAHTLRAFLFAGFSWKLQDTDLNTCGMSEPAATS